MKTRVIILRPTAPWLTPEIREQKIERRRLERKWRQTGLTVYREIYAEQSVLVNNLISNAKKDYYSERIGSCGSDQKELFKIVEGLNKGITEKKFPPASSAEVLANRFADFFESKINVIKQDLTWKCAQLVNPLPDSSLPQCETTLDSLTPVTCEELQSWSKVLGR